MDKEQTYTISSCTKTFGDTEYSIGYWNIFSGNLYRIENSNKTKQIDD